MCNFQEYLADTKVVFFIFILSDLLWDANSCIVFFFSFCDRFQVEKFVKLSLQDFVVGCVVLHIGHYEMMYTIDKFFAIFLKSEKFAKVAYLGKCSNLQYMASGRYSFHMRIRYTFQVINQTVGRV